MSDAAPLIGVVSAPVPEGGAAEWFAGARDARLRAALFAARGAVRGSVVVSPGRTEPIEKYFEIVEGLRERGFTVLVHDWRGQGLSARLLTDERLGHAEGSADFMVDFQRLLNAFEARLPKPWVAVSHSMGGCLSLLAMARGERRFSAAIMSAPMFGLQTGPFPRLVTRWVAAFAKAFGRAGAPAIKPEAAPAPFAANILTHDQRRYERNEALMIACPELGLGAPTWGWIDFALCATEELRTSAGVTEVTIPLTFLVCGKEGLVDNEAIRRVADRLPGARCVDIPGAFHEVLQETDDIIAVFWREFDALTARL